MTVLNLFTEKSKIKYEKMRDTSKIGIPDFFNIE